MPFIRTMLARDRLLTLTALAMLAGALVVVVIAPFEARVVTGINLWIKPLKFLVSIAIFLATMAWLMPEVHGSPRLRRWLARVFAGAMVVEVVCIAGQAARGTSSHFNRGTFFDAAIFQVMGVAITMNTIAAAVMWWQLRHDAAAGPGGLSAGRASGARALRLRQPAGIHDRRQPGPRGAGPRWRPGTPVRELGAGSRRSAHRPLRRPPRAAGAAVAGIRARPHGRHGLRRAPRRALDWPPSPGQA